MKLRVLVASLFFMQAAHADELLIRAGHLIDTAAGRQLGPTLIAIKDGRITAVGANLERPAGAKEIDLTDYTVLPGLIDSHTHLTIDTRNQDPLSELEHTAAERAFGSLPNARAVLLAGFTTVRD